VKGGGVCVWGGVSGGRPATCVCLHLWCVGLLVFCMIYGLRVCVCEGGGGQQKQLNAIGDANAEKRRAAINRYAASERFCRLSGLCAALAWSEVCSREHRALQLFSLYPAGWVSE
jgi:hypothetical protein